MGRLPLKSRTPEAKASVISVGFFVGVKTPTYQPWSAQEMRPHYNHLLLTELQRDAVEVVLVSPRNPLNIGAAARAMANFGFARLAVVAPFDRTWREARSAVGASERLQNAKET